MKRLFQIIMLLGVVVTVALPAAPLQAKQSWSVTVGWTTQDFAVVANTYQPRTIEIAVGDTVTWKFREIHTVSFLSGRSPLSLYQNLFVKESDKLVGNPQVFFPVGEKNYVGEGIYDGSGYHNSGIPPLEPTETLKFRYSLTFTRAGIYDYVCLLHGPAMSGRVIVKDRVAVTSAAFVKRAQTEQAETIAAGQAAWAKLTPQRQGNAVIVSMVGDLKAGYSIYRFTREPLVITRGTTVTWQMRDPFDMHTVTFTSGGKAPEFFVPDPQKQGPPKLVIPARVANPTQIKTYDGTGYVNSGILFPSGTFSGNLPTSFSLTFTKPGRYQYVCLVHLNPEGMRGTIVVK